jgi:hypothetical protein
VGAAAAPLVSLTLPMWVGSQPDRKSHTASPLGRRGGAGWGSFFSPRLIGSDAEEIRDRAVRTIGQLMKAQAQTVGVACFDPQWPNLKTAVAYFEIIARMAKPASSPESPDL